MIGKTLGQYQVMEKLDQGSVGEVYRAEDTNLRQHVAIKVLPDEFAHDTEQRALFDQVARLLAPRYPTNIAA